MRYPAVIDGKKGAYGATFPDLPGIVAMGKTLDEALVNAEEALRDYVVEAENGEDGRRSRRPVRSNRWKTPAGVCWCPSRCSVSRAGACAPTCCWMRAWPRSSPARREGAA